MTTKIQKADPALLEALRTPEALAALEALKKNNWLALNVPELKTMFADEPGHPAKAVLDAPAQTGGLVGAFQLALLASFTTFALLLSIFLPTMPPTLFVLWGTIGVGLALLNRHNPGRLRFLRKKELV